MIDIIFDREKWVIIIKKRAQMIPSDVTIIEYLNIDPDLFYHFIDQCNGITECLQGGTLYSSFKIYNQAVDMLERLSPYITMKYISS